MDKSMSSTQIPNGGSASAGPSKGSNLLQWFRGVSRSYTSHIDVMSKSLPSVDARYKGDCPAMNQRSISYESFQVQPSAVSKGNQGYFQRIKSTMIAYGTPPLTWVNKQYVDRIGYNNNEPCHYSTPVPHNNHGSRSDDTKRNSQYVGDNAMEARDQDQFLKDQQYWYQFYNNRHLQKQKDEQLQYTLQMKEMGCSDDTLVPENGWVLVQKNYDEAYSNINTMTNIASTSFSIGDPIAESGDPVMYPLCQYSLPASGDYESLSYQLRLQELPEIEVKDASAIMCRAQYDSQIMAPQYVKSAAQFFNVAHFRDLYPLEFQSNLNPNAQEWTGAVVEKKRLNPEAEEWFPPGVNDNKSKLKETSNTLKEDVKSNEDVRQDEELPTVIPMQDSKSRINERDSKVPELTIPCKTSDEDDDKTSSHSSSLELVYSPPSRSSSISSSKNSISESSFGSDFEFDESGLDEEDESDYEDDGIIFEDDDNSDSDCDVIFGESEDSTDCNDDLIAYIANANSDYNNEPTISVSCSVTPCIFVSVREFSEDSDDESEEIDWDESQSSTGNISDRDWEFGLGLNRKSTIQTQSKLLTYIDKERKNSLSESEKANLRWETDIDTNAKPKSENRVCFCDVPKIYYVDRNIERAGEWEIYAINSMRFRNRVRHLEPTLGPIFSPEHRNQIYLQRFQETND